MPGLKKNGTVRICGDFKFTGNPACLMKQYPISVIHDPLTALNGGHPFGTLNLQVSYNQDLDKNFKTLTVINTHRGVFCFNHLTFGVATPLPGSFSAENGDHAARPCWSASLPG